MSTLRRLIDTVAVHAGPRNRSSHEDVSKGTRRLTLASYVRTAREIESTSLAIAPPTKKSASVDSELSSVWLWRSTAGTKRVMCRLVGLVPCRNRGCHEC